LPNLFLHSEGPCYGDDNCGKNMKCVQREDKDSEEEFVETLRKFGCEGKVHFKADYCVDPDKKVSKKWWVTPNPTAYPTFPPTAKAEKRPRRWTDVSDVTSTLTVVSNTVKTMAVQERDPFKFTEMPSAAPSDSPTLHPTDEPTFSPTFSPTNEPTVDPFPPKPIPKEPESKYFDYSDDSDNGPSKWGDLKGTKMNEADYWDEFDEFLKPSLTENMCDYNKKTARQSPIDVSFEKATSQCFEYHQIRSKPGEWGVVHPKVEKQILPNKLRLVYDRKFEGGFEDADVSDMVKGASADMPKAWGYQLPVLNVDVKIPSEHWMEGK